MPADALEVAESLMRGRNPARFQVKTAVLTLLGVKQFYIAVDEEQWKLDTLCDLYEVLPLTQAIVFVNGHKK